MKKKLLIIIPSFLAGAIAGSVLTFYSKPSHVAPSKNNQETSTPKTISPQEAAKIVQPSDQEITVSGKIAKDSNNKFVIINTNSSEKLSIYADFSKVDLPQEFVGTINNKGEVVSQTGDSVPAVNITGKMVATTPQNTNQPIAPVLQVTKIERL